MIFLAIFAVCLFLQPGRISGQISTWEELIEEGNSAYDEDELTRAEQLYLESLRIARVLAPDDLRIITTTYNLAQVYTAQNRIQEADSLYRYVIAESSLRLPHDHPYVLKALVGLARLRNIPLEATAVADSNAPEPVEPELTPADSVNHRAVRGWLLSVAPGISMIIGANLSPQYNSGLTFGGEIFLPPMHVWIINLQLGAGIYGASMSGKDPGSSPYTIAGGTGIVATYIGPVSLLLGGGQFLMDDGTATNSAPGLIATGSIRLPLPDLLSFRSRLAVRLTGSGLMILGTAQSKTQTTDMVLASMNLGLRL